MALFAVSIRYTDDLNRLNETRPLHREYLSGLLEAGKVQQSGPYVDGTGALLIYEVADRAALDEILANDPYTRNGVIAESD
ncbi:MAG: YciI family protein, partial [Thermomicrobiales bacterium]